MNKNYTEKAKEYIRYNLSVIPTTIDKVPDRILNDLYKTTWKKYQTELPTDKEIEEIFNQSNPYGLSIVCGKVSGNLEVVDIDTKYDKTGLLWEDLKTLLEDNLPEIYSSLVIANSQSGGKHIYYRCETIQGNKKLANDENNKTLIETRGEGGYIVSFPSPGYSFIQLEPKDIPTITPEQRDIILSICKSFNQLAPKEEKAISKTTYSKHTGLSPFEDYNNRGDLIGLLKSKGWVVSKEDKDRIYLKRPGDTKTRYSGNYHKGYNVLRVFSSSTEFDTDKGYSPSQVYTLLECSGDYKVSYRKLLQQGYGEPFTPTQIETKLKTDYIQVDAIDIIGEVRTVSKPGQEISIETIENSSGDFLILAPPGEKAKTEILNTIKILQETGRRAYVKIEDEEKEVRDYKYQLQDIFDRYQDKENTTGNLTDQEVDNFQDEVVIIATRLQPIDRDVFFKFFTELEPIKKLGISIESLEKTVEKLHSISAKEKQTQDLINLLKEATYTAQKGNTNQALETLTKKLNQVKSTDKEEEFKKLIKPTNEEELKQSLKNKVEYLDSGYKIEKEDLLLPTGALSIFTAPTSHGKTTFLINLAINLTKTYQDKEVYFFSYEEDSTAIQINSFNSYLGKQISANNTKSIHSYFKTDSTEFIKEEERDYFLIKKEEFFQDYLSTGRLNVSYTDFDAESLVELIYYLHKNKNPLAIFIDYIQLLNLPQGKYKTYSRQEEVKTICNLLKNVSVDTGLPIILGAQFNRQVINLLRIHPSEIGEAGDIERFANLIVGFWNLEHKELIKDSDKKELEDKKGNNYSGLYTTVLKNRGGKVGQEEVLYFNGNTRTIKNNK